LKKGAEIRIKTGKLPLIQNNNNATSLPVGQIAAMAKT